MGRLGRSAVRAVTLSRRPLSEANVAANVLAHGVGCVNVDGCRVASGGEHMVRGVVSRATAPAGDTRQGASLGWWEPGNSFVPTNHPGGRWPANLVLAHLQGCERLGSRKVKATSIHGTSTAVRRSGVHSEAGGHQTVGALMPVSGYADEEGMEEVASWACVRGCPVADLDDQSFAHGIHGAGHARAGIAGSEYAASSFDMGGPRPMGRYGDEGGASRYFQQTQETVMSDVPSDLLEYLHTLVTPTQVGGEALVALDIGAVDWASIPDGRYHAVIAKGEPTEEEVDHMWRVIRPGAHVLLIAPDERPTGHRGACALEDRGFEIRDSILVVEEPGRLQYVPKANTKERNAGCEPLANKRRGDPLYLVREDADDGDVESLAAAMVESGIDDEEVTALLENGIPKPKVPKGFSHVLQRQESGKYGNNHPCVKPKEVMARLLSDVPKDAPVVDPFMGSGSTGLACLETGHDFIGIERESEYLEISDARVKHWAQSREAWKAPQIVSDAPQTEVPAAVSVEDGDVLDLFGD